MPPLARAAQTPVPEIRQPVDGLRHRRTGARPDAADPLRDQQRRPVDAPPARAQRQARRGQCGQDGSTADDRGTGPGRHTGQTVPAGAGFPSPVPAGGR